MTAPRRPALLPIEPLDEERWEAVERGLFARLDGDERAAVAERAATAPAVRATRAPRTPWATRFRLRRPVLLAALGALAALLLAVVGGWRFGASMSAAPRASAPTRAVSGSSASHLALGDNAIDLGPDTAVLAAGDDERGMLVVLDRGAVTCTVAPRGARPAFLVQAGDVLVRVVGTRFTVTRMGDGARVEVDHGVVEVSLGADRVTLRDGQSWTAPVASRGASAGPAAGAPTAAPAPSVPPEPAQPDPAPSASPSASARGSSPRERFEGAAQLERSDPARAAAVYARLAAAGGPWGANALFAQARLESDRGHHAQAARLASQYLARFPDGPNAGDARVLLGTK